MKLNKKVKKSTIIILTMIFALTYSVNVRAEEENIQVEEEPQSSTIEESYSEITSEEPEPEEVIEAEPVELSKPIEEKKKKDSRAATDIVIFDDPKVKHAVNKALGVTNLDADITEGQMTSTALVSVVIDEAGSITSFAGLEKATRLTTLTIGVSGERYSDTPTVKLATSDFSPLAGNVQVLRIYTSDVQLTSFQPFVGLTKLRDLTVNIAKITDFNALPSIPALKGISFFGNENEKVDLDPTKVQNLNLTNLTLEHINFTSDMNFSGLTNLQTIAINNTNVKDLSTLPQNAPITNVTFRNDPELKDFSAIGRNQNITGINITNTGLSDINFVKNLNLNNMIGLFLYDNKIEDLTPLEGLNMPTLFSIDLSGNKIEDISPLETLRISPFGYMNLRTNFITDISPLNYVIGTTTRVNATNQRATLPDVQIDKGTIVGIYDVDGSELQYFNGNDLWQRECGNFTFKDGELFWEKVTPKDVPNYNQLLAANFDVATNPSMTGRVIYSVVLTQNVTEVPEIVVVEKGEEGKNKDKVVKAVGKVSKVDTATKTGDNTNPYIFAVLLIMSFAIAVALYTERKHHKKVS